NFGIGALSVPKMPLPAASRYRAAPRSRSAAATKATIKRSNHLSILSYCEVKGADPAPQAARRQIAGLKRAALAPAFLPRAACGRRWCARPAAGNSQHDMVSTENLTFGCTLDYSDERRLPRLANRLRDALAPVA